MNGPDSHIVSAQEAFALLLETACSEFETLQALLTGQICMTNSSAATSGPDSLIQIPRVAATIRMALAKGFLFNANRANRVFTHSKATIAVDRKDRERFLKVTSVLADVRDVNEHGYDGTKRSAKRRPSMHEREGAMLDETALVFGGPGKIFMGPLNLYEIYVEMSRMRAIAGFRAD